MNMRLFSRTWVAAGLTLWAAAVAYDYAQGAMTKRQRQRDIDAARLLLQDERTKALVDSGNVTFLSTKRPAPSNPSFSEMRAEGELLLREDDA